MDAYDTQLDYPINVIHRIQYYISSCRLSAGPGSLIVIVPAASNPPCEQVLAAMVVVGC